MSQLSYDDEDYYFQISDELESDKEFVLIIYDIVDNRKRVKLAKLLSGYGKRVQKSAFEAMLTTQRYNKLIEEIPGYIDKTEDNVSDICLSLCIRFTPQLRIRTPKNKNAHTAWICFFPPGRKYFVLFFCLLFFLSTIVFP